MTAISRPARIGLITDQTGALSFMGIANANTATMVVTASCTRCAVAMRASQPLGHQMPTHNHSATAQDR